MAVGVFEFLTQQEVDRWPVAVVLNEMFQDLFDIYQKSIPGERGKTTATHIISINIYSI